MPNAFPGVEIDEGANANTIGGTTTAARNVISGNGLRGLERSNANAFSRCIYIHGTPEEKIIGKPASYGCVRMSSKDVAEVYAQIQIGALVRIIPDSLPNLPKLKSNPSQVIFTAATPQKRAPDSAASGKSRATDKHVSSTATPHLGSGA